MIACSRERVAAFVSDPMNTPVWYANIVAASWQTAPPLAVGSQMDFQARFLGRTLQYTFEVVELEPGHRLVMRTADGPFPMETTYRWESVPEGTVMILRNRGVPSGFGVIAAPLLVQAMKLAMRKDLRRLAEVLAAGV